MPSASEPDQADARTPYRSRPVGSPGPRAAAKRPRRWLDRVIGIVLGLALGIGLIVVFVFESSEDVIDAPRISGLEERPQPAARVPLIRVVDGKPPAGGPVRVDFGQGRRARFAVDSNRRLGIEIVRYGVARTVGPGRTLVSFRADRAGQYPVVVAATNIDIATLRVTRP